MTNNGQLPDLQIPYRKKQACALWDDTDVNLFVRGKYVKNILDLCCYKPGSECLELNCGPGVLALEVSRRGANVTGIDIASDAIQIAKDYQSKIIKQKNQGTINLFTGDLNTINLPEKQYDVVFVWDGLHHIAEIDHLVSEIAKTLKDEGVLVVHDHAGIPLWKRKLAEKTSRLLIHILPTENNYSKKIRKVKDSILKTNKKTQQEELLTSPFEGVSGENIIKSIKSKFKIVELQRYLSLTQHVAAKIQPDCRWRFGLISLIIVVDNLLSMLRILKPEYFFLIARKSPG